MNKWKVRLSTRADTKHKFVTVNAKTEEEAVDLAAEKLPNYNWGVDYVEKSGAIND